MIFLRKNVITPPPRVKFPADDGRSTNPSGRLAEIETCWKLNRIFVFSYRARGDETGHGSPLIIRKLGAGTFIRTRTETIPMTNARPSEHSLPIQLFGWQQCCTHSPPKKLIVNVGRGPRGDGSGR